MVRQVILEEAHVNYFRKLANSPNCTAGLIIGRTTTTKAYIARVVRCPKQVTDNGAKEWAEVKDVDGSWVAGHAAQVLPSLPGGIEIIGLFLLAESSDSRQVAEKLKQTLYRTYKLISKISEDVDKHFNTRTAEDRSFFWTSMHVDCKSGTAVSCRQYDVKDNKDSGRLVELKQVDMSIVWDSLETTLYVDQMYSIPDQAVGQNTFKSAMEFYCNKISKAYVTVDGSQRQSTEILNPSSGNQGGKASKKKKSLTKPASAKMLSCQFFILTNETKNTEAVQEVHKLHITGSISAKAYLPPGSTVGEACSALKHDIIQSIYQRCEILSEEEKDAQEDGNHVRCFPRRVYGKDVLDDTGSISYSEYILIGEPAEDFLERFKDNLDIEVQADDLITENCKEKFTASETMPPTVSIDQHGNDFEEIKSSATRTNAIFTLMATAVAFVAWIFSDLVIDNR